MEKTLLESLIESRDLLVRSIVVRESALTEEDQFFMKMLDQYISREILRDDGVFK
jgi:hypothetical protein